jgi:mannosyltransferase OCH1-like enzyme
VPAAGTCLGLYIQLHALYAQLACRYALLYTFGGFYMDLDIECRKPMDALRAYPFIMPQTRPVGFSNDFLASTPGARPSQLAEEPFHCCLRSCMQAELSLQRLWSVMCSFDAACTC